MFVPVPKISLPLACWKNCYAKSRGISWVNTTGVQHIRTVSIAGRSTELIPGQVGATMLNTQNVFHTIVTDHFKDAALMVFQQEHVVCNMATTDVCVCCTGCCISQAFAVYIDIIACDWRLATVLGTSKLLMRPEPQQKMKSDTSRSRRGERKNFIQSQSC